MLKKKKNKEGKGKAGQESEKLFHIAAEIAPMFVRSFRWFVCLLISSFVRRFVCVFACLFVGPCLSAAI